MGMSIFTYDTVTKKFGKPIYRWKEPFIMSRKIKFRGFYLTEKVENPILHDEI